MVVPRDFVLPGDGRLRDFVQRLPDHPRRSLGGDGVQEEVWTHPLPLVAASEERRVVDVAVVAHLGSDAKPIKSFRISASIACSAR